MKLIIWAVFAIWALLALLIFAASHGLGIAWAVAGIAVILIAGNWYRRPRRA